MTRFNVTIVDTAAATVGVGAWLILDVHAAIESWPNCHPSGNVLAWVVVLVESHF